jgi:N-acetylmuramoyl-L-alanine amidase
VPSRNIAPPVQIQGKSDAEGRTVHTVHRGETLVGIADRYGVSVADLRRWNRLKSNYVRRGTRLKVRTGEAATSTNEASASAGPVATKTPAKTSTDKSADKDAAGRVAADKGSTHRGSASKGSAGDAAVRAVDATVASMRGPAVSPAASDGAATAGAATQPTQRRAAPKMRVIVVRPGTTLAALAQEYGITVRDIMRLNHLRSSRILVGQRLRVPAG